MCTLLSSFCICDRVYQADQTFDMVQGINLQQQATDVNVPQAYIFNTFFWTRLACFGSDFDYAGGACCRQLRDLLHVADWLCIVSLIIDVQALINTACRPQTVLVDHSDLSARSEHNCCRGGALDKEG